MTIGERKMVKQKQRWVTEEEEALSAGVAKYGHGKWKHILSDPQFAPSLANRSNIDLKDKWRNMTVSGVGSSSRERVRVPVLEGLDLNMTLSGVGSSSRKRVRTPVLERLDLNMTVSGVGSSSRERVGTPVLEGLDVNMAVSGVGSSSRERVRTPVLEGLDLNMTESGVGSSSREKVRTPVLGLDLNLPISSPEPSSVLSLVAYGGTPEPSRSTVDRRATPDYVAMIYEALFTIEDPNRLDVTAILNFIEQRYELPQNFRRLVSSKLRRLLLAGELEKVGNHYKYKTSGQEDAIPMNVENINEGENEGDDRYKHITSGQEDAIPMNVENINEEENEEDGRYKYKTSGQEDAIPMNVENINEGENEEDGRYKQKISGQEDAIPMNVENINEGENEEDEIGKETPEDAAKVFAYVIAKAENMEQAAINACKKADRLEELLEESMVMLKIAEEIHERCSREGFVVLNL